MKCGILDIVAGYDVLYSFAKHIYMDDGNMVTDGFVIDKEILLISRAKIMALLIDDLPVKKKKFKFESS